MILQHSNIGTAANNARADSWGGNSVRMEGMGAGSWAWGQEAGHGDRKPLPQVFSSDCALPGTQKGPFRKGI